jgi:hypothetical protein
MFDAAYGAPALTPACAALLAQRKAALREMARSPLFTPRRRAAEKEANRLGKLYNACKRAAHKAKVEARKASASRPAPAPEAEPPDVPEVVDTPAGIVAAPSGPSTTVLVVGGVAALAIVGALLFAGKGGGGGGSAPVSYTSKRRRK